MRNSAVIGGFDADSILIDNSPILSYTLWVTARMISSPQQRFSDFMTVNNFVLLFSHWVPDVENIPVEHGERGRNLFRNRRPTLRLNFNSRSILQLAHDHSETAVVNEFGELFLSKSFHNKH